MAEQSKPVFGSQSRARFELHRSKADLWFNSEVKKARTPEDLDGLLFGYASHLFFVMAEEVYDIGLKENWSVVDVRETIEQVLENVIGGTFDDKHYYRDRVGAHLWKSGFRSEGRQVGV